MTDRRHGPWDPDPRYVSGGGVQYEKCGSCDAQKRTRFVGGGAPPLVEYLWSGIGWAEKRPPCEDPQLSLLPSSPPPAEPEPTHAVVHHCQAVECKEAIHPRFLMCRRHWWQVPAPLRHRVNETYLPGQERGRPPAAEWIKAARQAIAAVAQLEGKELPVDVPAPAAARAGFRLVRGGRE